MRANNAGETQKQLAELDMTGIERFAWSVSKLLTNKTLSDVLSTYSLEITDLRV